MILLKHIEKVAVIGGDRRSEIFASLMVNEGVETAIYGFDKSKAPTGATKCTCIECALRSTDLLLLPTPLTQGGGILYCPLHSEKISLSDVLRGAERDCIIVSSSHFEGEDDFKVINLSQYEPYLLKNALLTCEGALKVAIEESERSLFSSRILITGYGRIGKMLARQLKLLGCDVTVSARKPSDFAYAAVCGIRCIPTDTLPLHDMQYDIIFNTVPSKVLGKDTLSRLGEALIIELASKPYGVDLDGAQKLGIKAVVAGGLPGKVSPESAGKIIFDSVLQILKAGGDTLCSATV